MPRPSPAERIESGHSGRFSCVRPEIQLAEFGKRQHRLVTTPQLRAVGWDSSQVNKRVQQGRLWPVYRDVYALAGPPQTLHEKWMAAVLTFGPGTRLACSPAAELYGWLRFPTGQLHVITATRRASRDGITTHHSPAASRWRYIDDIPVTSPEQTILDCASTIISDRAYRRIVRQAQVDELTTHVRLLAFAAQNAGIRGVARLKRELTDGPSPTRSGFEDDVLDIFRKGGEPLVNHVIEGDEVDLFFPALGVVLEVDGSVHDNPTSRADDAAKQARLEARGLTVLRLA